jgi:hypothetical protein
LTGRIFGRKTFFARCQYAAFLSLLKCEAEETAIYNRRKIRKLSKLTLTAICACAALALAACGGAATETAKTSQPSNSTATTRSKTETATVKQSTPSETGESFFSAVKGKDAAAFKQLMSKDSMEILNAAAEEKKMSLDDLLNKQFFPNTPMPDKCEQRGEKITGEKATTEMKDAKGEWSPMTFVKESGVWKISLE